MPTRNSTKIHGSKKKAEFQSLTDEENKRWQNIYGKGGKMGVLYAEGSNIGEKVINPSDFPFFESDDLRLSKSPENPTILVPTAEPAGLPEELRHTPDTRELSFETFYLPLAEGFIRRSHKKSS